MQYFSQYILNESMHPEIEDIMNSEDIPIHNKLTAITKKFRQLNESGIETGFNDSKPKKGSSRAVFFPKDKLKFKLDGVDTEIPTAVKIPFKGMLDKYKTNDEDLLGQHQNNTESDYWLQKAYSVIEYNQPNHYVTNDNGILNPLMNNHHENHWLQFAKIDKLKKSEFQTLTKCDTHPKGIKFDDMYQVVNNEYELAHGKGVNFPEGDDLKKYQHIMEHPLVDNILDFVGNSGNHPADLHIGNWGKFTHPVTKKEYPVIADYGYSSEVFKEYQKRLKRQRQRYNQY